jgi:uncharacterized membrane protein YfcA
MEKDLLLVGTGFVVGGMNAIAGGGMLLGFPIMVALGLPPLVANATGSVGVLPGQISSAYGYKNYLRKVPLRYALLIIPCLLGALAGSYTLRHTAPDHFARLVPWLVLLGVALFAFQPLLHFHLHRHMKKRSRRLAPLMVLAAALAPITFYGGYFGPGFGFMLLAFLGFTTMEDTHTINAMKNVSAVFVASSSIVMLYSAHLIHWHTGLLLAAGCAIGGYAGARSAQKVSSHWLRILIICIGLAAVVYLLLREY